MFHSRGRRNLTGLLRFNKVFGHFLLSYRSNNYIAYPSLDLLASYNVANQITSIEDMIAQGAEMQTVVRLLCLASITSGGIKTKILERIKRDFLQVRMRPSPLLLDPNADHLGIWVQPSAPPFIACSPSALHTPVSPSPCSDTIRTCRLEVPLCFLTQVAPTFD